MCISPFHFSKQYMADITLFNCSLVVERGLYAAAPCFSGPGCQIYAIPSSDNIENLPLLSCTKMYNYSSVPYRFAAPANLYLEWSSSHCGQCETEGNECGLKKSIRSQMGCFQMRRASKGAMWKAIVDMMVGPVEVSSIRLLLAVAVYHSYTSDRKEIENQLKRERFLEDYTRMDL